MKHCLVTFGFLFFIGVIYISNNIYIYIHIKCHEEESCVDIQYLSIFSYCACAAASEMIKAGQNRPHHSIPQHGI